VDIVSEVADKIYLIGHYPENSIYGFQAFFIDDQKPTLIEPGPPNFIPKVLDGLHKLGYDVGSLSYIIPTHIHADHCGGTGHLARYAPGARIIAHEKGARHLVDPTRMTEATRVTWGEDYEAEIGTPLPVPWEQIDIVSGGETVALGKRTLSIVHSPGHAVHHICLYDAHSGDLFCGEALGLMLPGDEVTLLPIASPPIFELDLELDTIDRLGRLRLSTLLFSHHGVSHHARRCLEVIKENTRAWANIVLLALQDGESLAQIKARLTAIVERLQPDGAQLFSRFLDWTTVGYTGYFARQGIPSPNPEGQR